MAVNWDETLARVRSAAEFCTNAGLARFRIDEGQLEIDIRRPARASAPASVSNGSLEAGSNGAFEQPADIAALAERHKTLKAEFVGIVRFSRPVVTAGSVVHSDRELACVESLGIRNPVRSGGPCRIAEVFVSDGQPVGFGQPLLAIEPSGV